MSSEKQMTVEVVTAPADLGEGPHWSVKEGALYYVDIFKQDVHRYHPMSGTHSKMRIEGGPVTLVVPHAKVSKTFIVTVGRDLAVVTWPDPSQDCVVTSYKVLSSVDAQYPDNRFNDGKCDQQGRLWAGTMGATDVPDNENPHLGSLFVLHNNATVTKAIEKVSISNGLAWNSTSDTFYFVDTCEYKVESFNCDFQRGVLSKRKTVYDYRTNGLYPSFPDGMTVDADGNLWVACFGAGKVHCIEPSSGKVKKCVDLPTNSITSVCWGGPKLDHLYVTTTKKGLTKDQLSAQPHAGAVFRVTGTGSRGFPAPECNVTLPK
ncbi:regucalcin-like [Macrobrachium nipponense]|uniref:regucalcin-like n=1 Tax=Macrobrachium nipponense TaxID=159736 RepID=UPI0030C89448